MRDHLVCYLTNTTIRLASKQYRASSGLAVCGAVVISSSALSTPTAAEISYLRAVKVVAGREHECPLLYRMVEQFVEFHGKGIIKKLILDRGFLDGPNIGRCKLQWGIDVLIPARRDMDIYEDVVAAKQAH